MARRPSRPLPRTRGTAAAWNARNVILAGLGALAVGQRNVARFAQDAAAVPARLREGARAAVHTARSEAIQLRIDAAKRLNPLLARAGLPTLPAKAAARGTSARRPDAKPAPKARRRA